MILNSFLKANEVWFGIKYRKRLGVNLSSCYKAKNQNRPLKQKRIKQGREYIFVHDYPVDFLLSDGKNVLIRFCKRHNIKIKDTRPKKEHNVKKTLEVSEQPANSNGKNKRNRIKKPTFIKIEPKK
jgi:hypothetical protein